MAHTSAREGIGTQVLLMEFDAITHLFSSPPSGWILAGHLFVHLVLFGVGPLFKVLWDTDVVGTGNWYRVIAL